MSSVRHPTAREYRNQWAAKLRPRVSPSFKPPRVSVKPKRRVKRVNWVLHGLYSVAQFLRSISTEGPSCIVIEGVSSTKAVYIIGTTLHIHTLHLCKRDELNLILLATHLGLVDEVRIHNFDINHYFTARREHVRITQSYWRTVEFVLPYINRGPWVEREGVQERVIRITFDDFLCPAIEAWKAGKPYARVIYDIPEYETDPISTYTSLPHVHLDLSILIKESFIIMMEKMLIYIFFIRRWQNVSFGCRIFM